MTVQRAAAVAALALACAPAMRELPAPASSPRPSGADAGALLREAEQAWARRGDPAAAARAQELYRQAASADPARVDGLVGAMRAAGFRIERERDGAARQRLAVEAVQLGQECRRRAPSDPACAYRLAIALGQQARERTSTAKDALRRMVDLLHEAIAADPGQDRGGPRRVLALVLLRAPGWPLGPGDPEAALREARAAAELFPDDAENQLALGEALARNDRPDDARAAYERAAALAENAAAAGEPEAVRWRDDARAAVAKGGAP